MPPKYDESQIKSAFRAIKNGSTVLDAARIFEIPYQTLAFKWRKKETVVRKSGPKPILSQKAEKLLFAWVLEGEKKGNPRRRSQIKERAWQLAKKENNNNFGPLGPSNGWADKFMKRYQSMLSPNGTIPAPKPVKKINTDSVYHQFLQLIGPKMTKEFKNPNFLEELENKRILYETHKLLKNYEDQRLKALVLEEDEADEIENETISEEFNLVTVKEEEELILGETDEWR